MSVDCAPWEGAFSPVCIFGNLYFVGTCPASTHIIDTGDGLVMLDAGYQQSLYFVLDNMYRLGLNPHDLRYCLLTHGHIDHFGAARAIRELTGAKLAIGKADGGCANGSNDLSYAKELGMKFCETFDADILLNDGDEIKLGKTVIRAVSTPGHTQGAMSFFFNVSDGTESFRAGLHGGMGINTMSREYLDKYGLPYSLRDDFVCAMHRLNEEKVDIFLGNHMQHNHTAEKAEQVKSGSKYAFVNPDEWRKYNLWCIDNLKAMMERENKILRKEE